ncbi:molybdenum cofactor synthesis domain protein [Desulfatibacillum aliphaticivorans]|uniref:Molybdenum cofactor biosynthesis protein B n=1 Tax=Desulfatibacillum aliphaticivorans TaxID=218208 RepID=B8FAF8_DESAL|nr:MogA/MoaB family molybdenum cofactor biosynthesis protein [Desulfatibacillum aliphaticivorans]ACL03254.1 molybdenum cofactor synthesis domain protein [Desulfatibacillum aliphaticivorans]
MGVREHKSQAPVSVNAAVITVSTSRSLEQDKSGHWIAEQLREQGHKVIEHFVTPDLAPEIQSAVKRLVQSGEVSVVLINGGTGVTPSDVTVEAVHPLFDKELTAYGVLFAQLSFEEIGSAAMLSRAAAGVVGKTAVFCMPGSLGACKLACTSLILPELGHLIKHIAKDS